MFRIVGLNRSSHPDEEFVLLQQQGRMRARLRGHALIGDSSFDEADPDATFHFFADEVEIPSGAFVLVKTGCGESKWSRTADGYDVYVSYMNRRETVWSGREDPIHILSPQHTLSRRKDEAFVS